MTMVAKALLEHLGEAEPGCAIDKVEACAETCALLAKAASAHLPTAHGDWQLVGDILSLVCSHLVERAEPDWQKFSLWLGRLLPKQAEDSPPLPTAIVQARAGLRNTMLRASATFDPLPTPTSAEHSRAFRQLTTRLQKAAKKWSKLRPLVSSGETSAGAQAKSPPAAQKRARALEIDEMEVHAGHLPAPSTRRADSSWQPEDELVECFVDIAEVCYLCALLTSQ